MKKSLLAVPLTCALVLAPTAGALAHDHGEGDHGMSEQSSGVSTPATDLRASLDQLFSEHALLATYTMQKGADGAEDFEAIAASLDANTADLTEAITSVYGEEGGAEFERMWSEHIGYFVDYVEATGEGDEAGREEALANLDNYRAEFSTFLETASGERLDASMLAEGLQEHVQQLITAFDSYVEGDYGTTYDNARTAVHHMFGVSQGLSTAITDQFPEDFENTDPNTPAADLRSDLNYLFSEHAALAAFTMQKGIDGEEDFENIASALDENTADLTAAVTSVYGEEGGEAFDEMWNDHISFFVDYVVATGEEDEAGREEALTQLDNYRADFSEFLETATDGRLDATELSEGLQMHVDQLVTAFDSYADGNYETAYEQVREAYGHMYGVSEGLSGAIVDQFPENFESSMPDEMPQTGLGGASATGINTQILSVLFAFALASAGIYVFARKRQNA
ncbi:hypothetical protein [Shouchella shacheensis]|uniref:hypothetical protein n=1 Tax=Shouchella shacheensis TaxID=1649580 RepID=UPI00073FD351|nr:hypothetical protein [Shouchella shacheensis]